MVLAAVAAGATAAAKDTASQAVRDAYAGLKALVNKRFEKKPQAEMAWLSTRVPIVLIPALLMLLEISPAFPGT